MNVKSMTGFGRGETELDGRIWTAEIRSVNNRFLDIHIKLPRRYSGLEDRIRKKISGFHQRGRVDFFLNVQGDFTDLETIHINADLAGRYRQALADIAARLELEDDTSLAQLASYPDVIVRQQQAEDLDTAWENIEKALAEALAGCELMRVDEGRCLLEDLQQRLQLFVGNIERIEAIIPDLVVKREQSLRERLEKLLPQTEIDPMRIHQEIAILADKTDVTEELVRLRSHIGQFENFLSAEGSVGRKLDFLIQEFLREVNTLGSKINDAETAHLTVDLKSELEKIREQVQNIE
jgi:uncharacterized protein (TIGR00255 family)